MNDTTFQGDGKVAFVPVVVDAKPKPITNADAIRAMTDEELAKELKGIGCPGICRTKYREDDIEQCYKCWLGWLRQEVDNG